MTRTRLIRFIAVIQSLLFLIHLFLYKTWTFSPAGGDTPGAFWIKLGLGFLSVSFVAASLLAYRYTNAPLRAFYRAAAVWMGMLTFLFFAAVFSWIIFGVARLLGQNVIFHRIVEFLFAAAAVTGLFGVINASWTRITRTTVRLPQPAAAAAVTGLFGVINASWTRITRTTVRLANLPAAWRGRTAALISDVHLGHVRNGNFLRRMVVKILREAPDAIFIAGDLYDGTAIDAGRAAEPLSKLTAPHGVYFVAGNHEQFGDDSKYLNAIAAAGVRVLSNEKVEVDGLQIMGVSYRSAVRNREFASALQGMRLDRNRASILLVHAPDPPDVAEAPGVSLHLSGHTHLGQFIPWSWMARRVYRQFVYGLSQIGKMQVFTSSVAGTWGPPLRLGSNPEIVVLQFE